MLVVVPATTVLAVGVLIAKVVKVSWTKRVRPADEAHISRRASMR
ncbi:hypothetical protein ACIP4U_12140 [Streptomyces caelestis]|jgi:hypothetical protein